MKEFDISIKRFDEFAHEYSERFNNIDAYTPSIDIFCNLIRTSKPKILELACGPGNITKYVKQKFPYSEYIALDLAPKMIDIAREQTQGVDFRVMDVRNITTIESTFDSIMCSFCLPFLSKSDTYKLIADCATMLNKEGVIYLSTMEGDETKAGFESTNFSGDSKIYFNYHQQKDIEKDLLENDFTIYDFKRQVYLEDGMSFIDMIFIGIKKIL